MYGECIEVTHHDTGMDWCRDDRSCWIGSPIPPRSICDLSFSQIGFRLQGTMYKSFTSTGLKDSPPFLIRRVSSSPLIRSFTSSFVCQNFHGHKNQGRKLWVYVEKEKGFYFKMI